MIQILNKKENEAFKECSKTNLNDKSQYENQFENILKEFRQPNLNITKLNELKSNLIHSKNLKDDFGTLFYQLNKIDFIPR